MTVLNKIRAELLPMNEAQLRAVAAKTGVPFKTIARIRLGYTKDPLFSTVHALSQYRRSWRIR